MKKLIGFVVTLCAACSIAYADTPSGAGWAWSSDDAKAFSSNFGISVGGGGGSWSFLTSCKENSLEPADQTGDYQILQGLNKSGTTFLDYCFYSDKTQRVAGAGCYFKLSKPSGSNWVDQTVTITFDKGNVVSAKTTGPGVVTATALGSGVTCKVD